jgi:hypothetical protein
MWTYLNVIHAVFGDIEIKVPVSHAFTIIDVNELITVGRNLIRQCVKHINLKLVARTETTLSHINVA